MAAASAPTRASASAPGCDEAAAPHGVSAEAMRPSQQRARPQPGRARCAKHRCGGPPRLCACAGSAPTQSQVASRTPAAPRDPAPRVASAGGAALAQEARLAARGRGQRGTRARSHASRRRSARQRLGSGRARGRRRYGLTTRASSPALCAMGCCQSTAWSAKQLPELTGKARPNGDASRGCASGRASMPPHAHLAAPRLTRRHAQRVACRADGAGDGRKHRHRL